MLQDEPSSRKEECNSAGKDDNSYQEITPPERNSTPSGNPPQRNQNNSATAPQKSSDFILWSRLRNWCNDPSRKKPNVAEWVTMSLTLAIVLVGLVQACIYKAQFGIMKGQLSQMQAQERPRISVAKDATHELVPSDVYDIKTPPHKFRATIVVVNSGPTPALRVKTAACWIASSRSEYDPPSVDECHTDSPPNTPVCHSGIAAPVRETPLFPNGGYNTTDAREEFSLSSSEIEGIRHSDPVFIGDTSDRRWLYVVGCSTYDGEGGNHYRTQFCMIYAPKGPPSPLDILHPPDPNSPEADSVGYYNKVYRPCAGGNSAETQDTNGKYHTD